MVRLRDSNPEPANYTDRGLIATLKSYTGCLAPLAARLAAALGRDLLTEEERRAGFFVPHDLEGLLRGDLKSRFEAWPRRLGVGSLRP
jgi:hypothetical protein